MKKILSMLLVLAMLASSVLTVAAVQTPSVFTLSSGSCYVGETIDVAISLTATEAINTIGLAGFTYDSDVLEFVSFSDYEDSIKSLMVMEMSPDASKKALTLGLKSATTLDNKLCTMTFKVKAGAPEGTYTISATQPVTKNKSTTIASSVVPAEITVSKRAIEGLAFEGAEFTYDGTAKTLAVTGAPADATVTYESADFDADGKAIDAGTYNIKATVKKDGYKDWTKEAVLKINPKTITVTGLTAVDKVYDGTTVAELTGGQLNGLVARDAADQYCDEHQCYRIKCAIPMSGTFADKNASNDKAVSIGTITLDGCSKDNYVLTQPTGLKANIAKAPITVTAKDITVRTGSGFPSAAYGYDITAGALIGNDTLSGYLETNCTSTDVAGEFAITQGTLTAGPNYDLTFVNGKFSVVDKTVQNVTVDGIVTEKTYGDDGFKITVTPDANSNLDNFTFTSSNTNVAAIDANGNVTINNAGTTTISVNQAGNADYAPFEKTWTLTVKKLPITITAENKTKKIGQNDPQLTAQFSINPIRFDIIEVTLIREQGEEIGEYAITSKKITGADNYEVTFVPGVFEIVDKTPQSITVDGIVTEKTYGDDGFKVNVTADATSGLGNFTFASSNTNVATIDANGNVTINNAGTTTISVVEAGNAEYAPFNKTWTLTVKKVDVTITAEDKFKKIGQNDPELTFVLTGTLVNGDDITGELAREAGEAVGTYDITIGTLAINNNYNITFVGGVFEILDKTPQNITVANTVTEAVYGDSGFRVVITPDENSKLANFTLTSSDENVATIDANGNVTINNAGTTTISVVESGNEDYAPFDKTWTLTVAKAKVTITADNVSKKVGQADPELTYTVSGELFNNNQITGKLERTQGEEVGTYDITIGTLAINDNYEITFEPAVFEILDKTPQTITVAEIGEKIYGDAPFKVDVTADEASKLDVFTYSIDNNDVADIEEDGTVIIKSIGKATITVKQAGDEEYAEATATVELIVNPRPVTVTAIDLDNQVAEINGILVNDNVTIDFDKVQATVVSVDKVDVDGVTKLITTSNVTNFKLKDLVEDADKAKNYVVANADAVFVVQSEAISADITTDENVNIEAAVVGSNTVIITDATVAPETEKVSIDTTSIGNAVNTVALQLEAVEAIKNAADAFELILAANDGKNATLNFNANAINEVYAAVYASVYEQYGIPATISISASNVEATDLTVAQKNVFDGVSDTNKVVYSFNILDNLGNKHSSFGTGGEATVTVPFVKTTNGKIVVKYIANDGTYEEISNPSYDSVAQLVTFKLNHFSEYLIYTEPASAPTPSYSGGGGSSQITVKFDSNGGSTVKSISVNKNAVIKEPEAPVKEGFEFAGWYTDKDLTTPYDFSAKVTKAFTLYAKWTEIEEDKPEWKNTFSDVSEKDWFYASVKYAVENKLMNGVSETEFAPNATLTRAMLVTVLYRNAGEPATNRSIPFADVDMGAYYASAVSWAKQNGIVNGITENEFAPNAEITREQIAAIMFRYAQYKGMEAITMEENLHFDDANEISEYAITAMNWAVGKGLMKGKTETTINSKDNATRAEIATILQRFIESIK